MKNFLPYVSIHLRRLLFPPHIHSTYEYIFPISTKFGRKKPRNLIHSTSSTFLIFYLTKNQIRRPRPSRALSPTGRMIKKPSVFHPRTEPSDSLSAMRGALLRNLYLYSRNLHSFRNLELTPIVSNGLTNCYGGYSTENAPVIHPFPAAIRYLSSGNDNDESESSVGNSEGKKEVTNDAEDVSNKELKLQIEDYFNNFNEEALPSILESILKRRLAGKHGDTDDELMDELHREPLDNVKDEDFESDFEEAHETDEEIDDLYNTREIVMKQMTSDPYGNMDDRKWDEMIKEATEHGYLKDTRECEEILEDMLHWDKLLPDKIKKKVQKKFDEIADRVEKGELEVEEGYALFKEFEDQVVLECTKQMEAEESPQFDETVVPDNKKELDDPPGEGPILRWQTRVVFAPGGDAWHPKNRKVKLAVTVKELGLSKHQFLRLRELAGKRYNPGKDELTITSERFEHREENRKDCLRTLFALIEDAGKARKLVEDARISEVKRRLVANPKFMQRLQAKKEATA